MTRSLEERMKDARNILDSIEKALARHPGKLPADVETLVAATVRSRDDIGHWLRLCEARREARNALDGLETQVDSDDCVPVPFGSSRIKFQLARFLGVQSYVATTWALADSITPMAGPIVCTSPANPKRAQPVQLVQHFINNDRAKEKTAELMFRSVRDSFGWPIGISYAIRNHFVHDGAQKFGADFFEGPSAMSGFRISDDGWKHIQDRVRTKYKVDSAHDRNATSWPDPPDDLRVVLDDCERVLDEALGVILGSVCGLLHAHVGLMLHEDGPRMGSGNTPALRPSSERP